MAGGTTLQPQTLNALTLADLSDLIGPARLTAMLASFFADAKRRVERLAAAGPVSGDMLFEHAHALISLAGHLGLEELSELCIELQEQALADRGLDRVSDLREAVVRAADAVRQSDVVALA